MADPILVVDNDLATARLIEGLLGFTGFSVISVRSVLEGVEVAGSRRLAVMFLNASLPDSIAVARHLKGNLGAEMQLVMMREDASVPESAEALADVWLTKPLTAVSLHGALQEAFGDAWGGQSPRITSPGAPSRQAPAPPVSRSPVSRPLAGDGLEFTDGDDDALLMEQLGIDRVRGGTLTKQAVAENPWATRPNQPVAVDLGATRPSQPVALAPSTLPASPAPQEFGAVDEIEEFIDFDDFDDFEVEVDDVDQPPQPVPGGPTGPRHAAATVDEATDAAPAPQTEDDDDLLPRARDDPDPGPQDGDSADSHVARRRPRRRTRPSGSIVAFAPESEDDISAGSTRHEIQALPAELLGWDQQVGAGPKVDFGLKRHATAPMARPSVGDCPPGPPPDAEPAGGDDMKAFQDLELELKAAHMEMRMLDKRVEELTRELTAKEDAIAAAVRARGDVEIAREQREEALASANKAVLELRVELAGSIRREAKALESAQGQATGQGDELDRLGKAYAEAQSTNERLKAHVLELERLAESAHLEVEQVSKARDAAAAGSRASEQGRDELLLQLEALREELGAAERTLDVTAQERDVAVTSGERAVAELKTVAASLGERWDETERLQADMAAASEAWAAQADELQAALEVAQNAQAEATERGAREAARADAAALEVAEAAKGLTEVREQLAKRVDREGATEEAQAHKAARLEANLAEVTTALESAREETEAARAQADSDIAALAANVAESKDAVDAIAGVRRDLQSARRGAAVAERELKAEQRKHDNQLKRQEGMFAQERLKHEEEVATMLAAVTKATEALGRQTTQAEELAAKVEGLEAEAAKVAVLEAEAEAAKAAVLEAEAANAVVLEAEAAKVAVLEAEAAKVAGLEAEAAKVAGLEAEAAKVAGLAADLEEVRAENLRVVQALEEAREENVRAVQTLEEAREESRRELARAEQAEAALEVARAEAEEAERQILSVRQERTVAEEAAMVAEDRRAVAERKLGVAVEAAGTAANAASQAASVAAVLEAGKMEAEERSQRAVEEASKATAELAVAREAAIVAGREREALEVQLAESARALAAGESAAEERSKQVVAETSRAAAELAAAREAAVIAGREREALEAQLEESAGALAAGEAAVEERSRQAVAEASKVAAELVAAREAAVVAGREREALETQLAESAGALAAGEAAVEERNKQVVAEASKVAAELVAAREAAVVAGREREALEAQLAESAGALEALEATVEQLEGRLAPAQAEIASLKREFAEERAGAAALEAEAEFMRSALEVSEAKDAESAVSGKARRAKITELEMRLAGLAGVLEEANRKLFKADVSLRDASGHLATASQRITELESQVAVLEDGRRDLAQKGEALAGKVAEAEAQVIHLSGELGRAASASHGASGAREELEVLQEKFGRLEVTVKEAVGRRELLQTMNSQLETRLLELRDDRDYLSAQVAELQMAGAGDAEEVDPGMSVAEAPAVASDQLSSDRWKASFVQSQAEIEVLRRAIVELERASLGRPSAVVGGALDSLLGLVASQRVEIGKESLRWQHSKKSVGQQVQKLLGLAQRIPKLQAGPDNIYVMLEPLQHLLLIGTEALDNAEGMLEEQHEAIMARMA